jgi:hypothetical protein
MQITAMEKRGDYLREINMFFTRASVKIHKYFIKQYTQKKKNTVNIKTVQYFLCLASVTFG